MTRQLWAAIVGAVIAIGAAAPPLSAQTAGRRFALLIGVNAALQPGVRKLNFVDNDLIELERLLKRQGYQVRTLPNERADRQRIIQELYRHALALSERDTFVLYFAGHGVRNAEVNQKTYWLTDDADLRMLDVHGIRLEHLLSYVDDIRAVRKLILLDHCFSGDVANLSIPSTDVVAPLAPPAAATVPASNAPPPSDASRTATVVIEPEMKMPRRDGTTVIAAARGEAFELKAIKHGVFTRALLDACASVEGAGSNYKRSVMELIGFLQPRVDELLKGASTQQTLIDRLPAGAISLEWTFCTLPVPPQELGRHTGDLQTTIQSWETKGLLPPLLRIACTGILDKWRNAAGDAAFLSEGEQRVLVAIRLFADADAFTPEQARVASLIHVLREEGY